MLRLRVARGTCVTIGRRPAPIEPAVNGLDDGARRVHHPRTRVDAQWVKPAFAGQRSVRSVMVMAAIRDSTNRRTGCHNAMWATSVPPRVTTTQNVHACTRVFDAGDAAVVWSAATTTSTGLGFGAATDRAVRRPDPT
jgi:hypothetical protein